MEIGPLLMLVINQKCQDVTGKSQVKKQTKKKQSDTNDSSKIITHKSQFCVLFDSDDFSF